MAAPTTLLLTKVTANGTHKLDDECRRVTLMAIGANITLSVGGDAPELPNGGAIAFQDPNLAGTDLTIGGISGTTLSVFEELGAGA